MKPLERELQPQVQAPPSSASCSLWGYQPQCNVPCQAPHEMTFGDRDVGFASCGEAVVVERPRSVGGKFEGFLSDLYARVDIELAATPLRACALETVRSRDHEDVVRMWQRFREVVDLPAFRTLIRTRQASETSLVHGSCFEVSLKRDAAASGSHGFAVHQSGVYDNILIVDDITLGGDLDALNQQTRALGRLRFCVHPLAVIVAVNGFSDHCTRMTQELQKPVVVLHVVNPPTVLDVVAVYDMLKDGTTLPMPFWETCGVALDADMSVESAQMPDSATRLAGQPSCVSPSQFRPFSENPIPEPSPTPELPRRQLPEFGADPTSTSKPLCWRNKGRGCVPAEQMDECLQPPGATMCGGPGTRSRRNFF